jgi:hypothetical protein
VLLGKTKLSLFHFCSSQEENGTLSHKMREESTKHLTKGLISRLYKTTLRTGLQKRRSDLNRLLKIEEEVQHC